MDSFAQSILERARERQKMLQEFSKNENSDPELLDDPVLKSSSQPNLSERKEKLMNRKEIVSESDLDKKPAPAVTKVLKEINSEDASSGKPLRLSRQGSISNSKTTVVSDLPGSPKSQPKTLNFTREDFNMEIKLTSLENVRLEVEFRDDDENENDNQDNENDDQGSIDHDQNSDVGLREEAKSRLKRLGKLYAGGDDANISSPIHRTEEKFCQDEEEEPGKANKVVKHGKGLRGLTTLAQSINQWEDTITPSQQKRKKTPPKRNWKPPAPQPPNQKSTGSPLSKMPRITEAITKTSQTESSLAINNVRETPTKSLQLDKKLLNTLECQGFTRTTSNSRLVFKYDSKNESESHKVDTIKEDVETEEGTETQPPSLVASVIKKLSPLDQLPPQPANKACSRSPAKPRSAAIASKASLFESSPSKASSSKDPALLSVSERKALFERNKGEALIPKAPFAMSIPAETQKKPPQKIGPSPKKYPAPQPPTTSGPSPGVGLPTKPSVSFIDSPASLKPAVSQASGIASTLAALMESKNTISQSQIEGNVKAQRQQEMEMLLNRFNKKKEISSEVIHEESEESDDENVSEKTAMIKKSGTPVIKSAVPSAPPMPTPPTGEKGKGAGKRLSAAVSPKVAAVLEDYKRIKVSPAKVGKLYPNLSDIEAATETETETLTRTPSPVNDENSFRSTSESDDANTSFGREIMQVVCKNQQKSQKRLFNESSSQSDMSDILDGEDSYIDEALAYNRKSGTGDYPTPSKRRSLSPENNQAQPSNSFHYKNFSPSTRSKKSPGGKFKSPIKIITSPNRQPPADLPTHIVDGDNVMPLTHTVSFYRKQQNQECNKTPVRQITRQPIIEETATSSETDAEDLRVQEKMSELLETIHKQRLIMFQASKSINLCNNTPEFMGSTEQVEAERVLLIATHTAQAALHESQRLQVEKSLRPLGKPASNIPIDKGTLTISNIVLPLKREYVRALAAAGGKGHHVICLIKSGEQVVATKLVSTVVNNKKDPELEVRVPGTYTLNDIYSDFTVKLEVYCLQAQEEFLPHEVKYHIKKSGKSTPKKSKQDSRLVQPPRESPGGPQVILSPSFALMGYVCFSIQALNQKNWTLNNTPSKSPLLGAIEMRMNCEMAVSVEHRGFLTMFEDISGFGAWHRRWCLLKGHSLTYWKYPDDEKNQPPIDSIDLSSCITKEVGLVSREICARLHTFLIERERIAHPSDKDSLVMICKGNTTIIRHLLSADTKEERVEWCNKFNSCLTAMKMCGNSNK